jgi:hypothetical protein
VPFEDAICHILWHQSSGHKLTKSLTGTVAIESAIEATLDEVALQVWLERQSRCTRNARELTWKALRVAGYGSGTLCDVHAVVRSRPLAYLPQSSRLNLTNPLARQGELLSDFLKRAWSFLTDSEAHA